MTTEADSSVDVRDPRPASLGIDPALFHEVDALKAQVKTREADTKAVKVQLAEREELLVEQMALAGVAEIMLDGRKGSLQPTLWAAKADDSVTTGQIVAALRESDLEWLITPESTNWQSLSSYVREMDEAGEELPEPLTEVLQVVQRTKVGFTRGTAAQRRRAARATTSGDSPEVGESPA